MRGHYNRIWVKSHKSTKGNSHIAASPRRNVMDTSALQHSTARQSMVLHILYQGIAASPSQNVIRNSALQHPTALWSMVLHIVRQDTRLPVLGRGLVCQVLPFMSSSSLALPSVLAATAPTSQSHPLQLPPAREAQWMVAKGKHCGSLSLKVCQVSDLGVV